MHYFRYYKDMQLGKCDAYFKIRNVLLGLEREISLNFHPVNIP